MTSPSLPPPAANEPQPPVASPAELPASARPRSFDLIRLMLAVLALGMLLGLSFWIMRPFLAPLLWASTIVVATWPVMLVVQRHLWGRRALAVTVMSLLLAVTFVIPFVLAIYTIVTNVDEIAGWAKTLSAVEIPLAPEWVSKLPMVGERAAALWNGLAEEGRGALAKKVAPYAGTLARWFAAEVGGFGAVALQFLLTLVIAAILFATGDTAGRGVHRFAWRLAGERGEGAVRLAAGAIRGVALGVVLTALIQSVLGGIGLAITGVPFAGLLTAVMFMLTVAQIGPIPVLVPAIIWLYWTGETGWAIALAVITAFVGTIDNFIRPMLIKRGADLPLLLIFAGVIGGLVAFGLVGIFIGPVVLAVTYTLLAAWVAERPAPPSMSETVSVTVALAPSPPPPTPPSSAVEPPAAPPGRSD